MADLYTSLIQAKQELNNGILPPMTPVPENVQHFIDPEFTPGLGALNEDPEKGLQCPVRGCGRWWQSLSRHLNGSHGDIGGTHAILRALDIPQTVPLVSRKYRTRQRETMLRTWASGALSKEAASENGKRRKRKGRRTGKSATHRSTGYRNLQNTCVAQLSHRLLDLSNKLGRSPGYREAKTLDGPLVSSCITLFGSWSAAKAHVGLKVRARAGKYDKTNVIEILRAYHEIHGVLPTIDDFCYQVRPPLLPSVGAIKRGLGEQDWRKAMRMVAVRLNIYEPRYRPAPGERGSLPQVYTRDGLLAALHEFYTVHGQFPTWSECGHGNGSGMPGAHTIKKHLGAVSWKDAMYLTAVHFGVYDIRYRPEQTV